MVSLCYLVKGSQIYLPLGRFIAASSAVSGGLERMAPNGSIERSVLRLMAKQWDNGTLVRELCVIVGTRMMKEIEK